MNTTFSLERAKTVTNDDPRGFPPHYAWREVSTIEVEI